MVLYNSVTVPPSTNQLLLSFVVPARGNYQATSIIVWGNADGEYSIYKNAGQLGGGRTSTAQPTLQLSYGQEIGLAAFDVFSLYGKHNESTSQLFQYSILMEQL